MGNTISDLRNSEPLTISESRKELDREIREKLRSEEIERRRESHIRALGGVGPYAQYTFENFDPNLNGTHRILKACVEFNAIKENLFILGGQGKGKTHLSTAIARHILEQGGRAKVFRGKELAVQLRGRKSYAMDHDEVDAIADLVKLNVIVVDDIEDGPNREAYFSSFKVLLEKRKDEQRYGFIITSNKTVTELSSIVGPKISDRIEGEFKHLVIPDSIPSVRAILKAHKKSPVDKNES